MEEERKVKGSMLLDFVKMIRAHKQLDWNKYLQPADWKIIDSIILPAKWYPLDIYKRCSTAAFHLLGKDDLQAARTNGQAMGKHLFETTYKSIVQGKDPMQALNQYVLTYSSFFNFSILKLEKLGPRKAKIIQNYDKARDRSIIPYCYMLQGLFETLLQMTGGKNYNVVISEKQWEGAPVTVFEITWE